MKKKTQTTKKVPFDSEVFVRAEEAEVKLAKIARTRRPTEEERNEALAAYAAAAAMQRPEVVAEQTTFFIVGTFTRGSEETPAFDAVLMLGGRAVARTTSEGRGGCARVEWLAAATAAVREDATKWLRDEALRLYPNEGLTEAFLVPSETALLVVPEHIEARRRARRAS